MHIRQCVSEDLVPAVPQQNKRQALHAKEQWASKIPATVCSEWQCVGDSASDAVLLT